MPLPQKNLQEINLADATRFAKSFRQNVTPLTIKGGLFWRESIEKILNQDNCVAIRYYYGVDDMGASVLILVGVNKDGIDVAEGTIAELGWPCPPFCDSTSPLNS